MAIVGAVIVAGVALGAVQIASHPSAAPTGPNPVTTGGTQPVTGGQPGPDTNVAPHYHGAGYPFAARFIATPKTSTQRLLFDAIPFTATNYSASVGSTTMDVTVFPLPLGNPKGFSFRKFAASFVAREAPSSAAHTVGIRHVQRIDGIRAVSVAATASGGSFGSFGVFLFDGHVVYWLSVSGPATTVSTTYSQALRNFRVLRPALGRTI